ncbi:helix-turn-helix domain-containing protein [Haloarchaeobius sp. HRN-SO-5]|uniref:helix-turn-helix domain-containing protein n=1 Tax=Haloarchaeobius sp. HRN-SO-5 TaxID=3446118 RepID=UPI003EB6B392
MPAAKLTVTIPDEAWIAAVSNAHEGSVFRVVTLLPGTESSVALVELQADDPVPILADVENRPDVESVELLWTDDGATLLQVETTDPVLLVPVWEAGVPVQTPFDVVDGTATWELTTSSSRLSALGTQLDAAGIQFDIEYVRRIDGGESEAVLTDRQREVLLAAIERGYYETPRRATLTEVADSLDVSKATASDVLHRAEGRIVDWFVANVLEP